MITSALVGVLWSCIHWNITSLLHWCFNGAWNKDCIISHPRAHNEWMNERGKWCCALPARGNATSFCSVLSTYNNELGVALRCSRRAIPSPKMGLSSRCLTLKWFLGCWWCMSSIRAGPYTASCTPNPVTALKGTAALHLTSLSSLDFRWEELFSFSWLSHCFITIQLLHVSTAQYLFCSGPQWWNWIQPTVQSGQIWH